jgi:hypothetical protein
VSAYIPIVTPRGTTVAMQQLQFAPESIAALEERGLEALESPLMSGQPVVVPAGGTAHGGATAGEAWGEALGKWGGVPALHKHWSTLGILQLSRLLLGTASAPLPPSYTHAHKHKALHVLPDAVGAIRCTLYLYTHLVASACPIWLSLPAVLQ